MRYALRHWDGLILSTTAAWRWVHVAAPLFVLGVALLVAALFRFGQEVRIGLSEADHYR